MRRRGRRLAHTHLYAWSVSCIIMSIHFGQSLCVCRPVRSPARDSAKITHSASAQTGRCVLTTDGLNLPTGLSSNLDAHQPACTDLHVHLHTNLHANPADLYFKHMSAPDKRTVAPLPDTCSAWLMVATPSESITHSSLAHDTERVPPSSAAPSMHIQSYLHICLDGKQLLRGRRFLPVEICNCPCQRHLRWQTNEPQAAEQNARHAG